VADLLKEMELLRGLCDAVEPNAPPVDFLAEADRENSGRGNSMRRVACCCGYDLCSLVDLVSVWLVLAEVDVGAGGV
jgi:hypothetical protein